MGPILFEIRLHPTGDVTEIHHIEELFMIELVENLLDQGAGAVYTPLPRRPEIPKGAAPPTEFLVALGSAGAFTAVYKIICKYLERHKDRELTLEKDNVKVTLKGHSLPEERALMKELSLESLQESQSAGTSDDIG